MAEENPKIIIKDYNSPIEDTRLKYLDETDQLIRGRRGFLFGGFKNEKERIKSQIEKNKLFCNIESNTSLEKSIKIKNKVKNNNNNNNNKLHKSSSLPILLKEKKKNIPTKKITRYVQPVMRFKPRTDLERIYDSVNLNYYGSINRKIVDRQLKYLDLNIPMKVENEEPIILEKNLIEETEEESSKEANEINFYDNDDNSEMNNKKNVNYLQKKPINIDSKKIMEKFHYKTHFKAIQSIALSREKLNHTIKKEYYKPNYKVAISPIEELEKEDEEIQKYINSKQYNNLINNRSYYLNNNKKIHINDKKVSQEYIQKLKILEKIAFQRENFSSENNKNKIIKENEEDFKTYDNRIKIGNKIFYLNEEMDKAANAVLNKCNVYHKKNKFSQGTLKNGNGKLMITGGLTINEFLTKYNL